MRLDIDIYDQIFKFSKKYIKEKSIYNPEILKQAPTESNIFPLVIIPECKIVLNKETLKTRSKKEKEYRIIFNIELYAIDKTIDKKRISKQTILSELKNLIYEIFEDKLCFLGYAPTPMPNADINVAKEGIRFVAIYKNQIFYRR